MKSIRTFPWAKLNHGSAERGASLVEYALGMALIAVVLLSVLQTVTDNAEQSLAGRGDTIGHPADEGGTTSTTTGGGPGGTSTSTSTVPGYAGTIDGICNGSNGNKNECSFTLDPDPSPAIATWSIVPPSGFTGTPPIVTFTEAGGRTIRATVNGVTVQRVVNCSSNGSGKISCDLA